ncbi:MAG: peroxidase [Actinobacteria bacterium]|nr:peroxidase [Actinomycetota bacterium]
MSTSSQTSSDSGAAAPAKGAGIADRPSATTTTPLAQQGHASNQRGLLVTPSSSTRTGRFGRMFRNVPVFLHTEDALAALAAAMVSEVEKDDAGKPTVTPEGEFDQEETGPASEDVVAPFPHGQEPIPAGYTYLGQFIDHDITFDPASSLERQNDPDGLTNFRTPAFDLDSIYGRGPSDQPYLYDQSNPGELLLGRDLRAGTDVAAELNRPDLPRRRLTSSDIPRNAQDRGLTGDPRNDENLIVSQIQSVFLRFHNAVWRHVGRTTSLTGDDRFKEAQRLTRWCYQWVVIHDFLPRIVGRPMVDDVLRQEHIDVPGRPGHANTTANLAAPRLRFYKADAAFMPVEFAVAAYRFGHSMVRPIYRINNIAPRLVIFGDNPETPNPGPDRKERNNLEGFRAVRQTDWGIDWGFFFEMSANGRPRVEPQGAYRIDQQLVNALGTLPPSVAQGIVSLAHRNLLRGLRVGLPSGQAVARRMGLEPLTEEELLVGARPEPGGKDDRPQLSSIDEQFRGNAPLWYYVLREAEVYNDGNRLGPVGGRMVAETFVGLLFEDRLSYLRVEPGWRPPDEFANVGRRFPSGTRPFRMPELVAFALSA